MINLSIGWNVPKFFELHTCYLPANQTSLDSRDYEYEDDRNISTEGDEQLTNLLPEVCVSDLRDSYHYSRDYILIGNFIVMKFIPFLLLLVLNSLTFRKIHKTSRSTQRSRKRRDRDFSIAMMLSAIALVFLLSSVPRMILNIWEVSLFYSSNCKKL